MAADTGFAYAFQGAELSMGTRIYTNIKNVSIDQPTTEGAVMGTRPGPIKRTVGSMGLGDGEIQFSDVEEKAAFLNDLGDGFREKEWALTWTKSAPGKPKIVTKCMRCRVLSNPDDDAEGEDALGGSIKFSFMDHTINGKRPHTGTI